MVFKRHPASLVSEQGILYIDRDAKRIRRTMTKGCEAFVSSDAFKEKAGEFWPKAEKIDKKMWEIEYLEYPMQLQEMTNNQILKSHIFLCDVLEYLNIHGFTLVSHAFNVVLNGNNRYMLIDLGDFMKFNEEFQARTLTACLGNLGRKHPWMHDYKHMWDFINKNTANLNLIKNEFIKVGCKPDQSVAIWDKYSGVYESMTDVMNKSKNKKYSTAMEYIKDKMPNNLTDLGCNTGKISLYAASLGIKCIGLDYAAKTINMAELSAENCGLDLCQFGFVNILSPNIRSTYDPPNLKFKSEMVIASALLHHLFSACEDINRCIDTILDYTTKYVGIEFIPNNDRHIRKPVTKWFTLEQIEKRLEFNGYKITEVVNSEPNPRKWIFAEKVQ